MKPQGCNGVLICIARWLIRCALNRKTMKQIFENTANARGNLPARMVDAAPDHAARRWAGLGARAYPEFTFQIWRNALCIISRLTRGLIHRLVRWLTGVEHNVGSCEFTIRFSIGCVILVLTAGHPSWKLLIATVLLITAIFQYCPLWKLFHIDTTSFDRPWWADLDEENRS